MDVVSSLSISIATQIRPGPVLRKRPLEYFLPFRDEVLGKISNAFPRFFLSQLDKARARGKRNFASPNYRPEP